MAARTVRRLRIVPVAAAVWATAFGATHLPEAAGATALLLWAATLSTLSVLHARRRRDPARARRVIVIVVIALAASAAAASHVALAEPVREAARALPVSGGRAVTIEAVVTGKVERRAGGQAVFDARATRAQIGARERMLGVEVGVLAAPDRIDHRELLDVGAVVLVHGTVSPARAGDRAVWLIAASRGVEVVAPPDGVFAVTAALRRGLVDAVEGLPAPGAGLVPGLAVGDTSAVDPTLDVEMKASSLSHLTAVSGANCAIVVGLAFAVAAAMGARRSARVLVGGCALAGFVLLVTPEPSVVRAAAMGAIAMLGIQLGRVGPGIAVLSLGVAAMLIADPWLAGSLGFALSVAATGALLLWTPALTQGLARWMPRPLALMLAVPLTAQLACGPLLVLIAPSVPLYGVVANLLAAPAAPVATIVGLAACLALPVPLIASGLAGVAWLPAAWIAGTAATMAGLPGHSVPWTPGWAGVALLAGAGASLGIIVRGRPSAARGRAVILHGAAVAVASITAGAVLGSGALTSVAGPLTVPQAWAVAVCDVGQGDAILLRSAGQVALVDTGPAPEPLAACLTRFGVARVDLLVLTHFDLDHAGGAAAVRGKVGTLLHGPAGSGDDDVLVDDLVAAGARAVPARAAMTGALGDARWRVLWPRADSRAYEPGNDAGIVLELAGGGLPSILLLADLSASAQRSLLHSGALASGYDVVKVAHHGSADQAPELYDAVGAAVALLSVGVGNDYGHPRADTLRLLDERGAAVARTDLSGAVALWTEPSGVVVWRERGPPVSATLSRLEVWRQLRDERPRARHASPSPNCPGDPRNPRRSCWCRDRRRSVRSGPRPRCAIICGPRTRASR